MFWYLPAGTLLFDIIIWFPLETPRQISIFREAFDPSQLSDILEASFKLPLITIPSDSALFTDSSVNSPLAWNVTRKQIKISPALATSFLTSWRSWVKRKTLHTQAYPTSGFIILIGLLTGPVQCYLGLDPWHFTHKITNISLTWDFEYGTLLASIRMSFPFRSLLLPPSLLLLSCNSQALLPTP